MPRALPDRWVPYKACGKVIEGTRIICFKVPLKTSIQTNNPEIKEIWDVKTLLQSIPNLGLVIDLTNTKRYYDPYLVKSAGVDHLKLLMPGRILPPENIVKEFMGAIDDFLQKDKDRLVGVHCTHGLNRTGYMVCRYMRDRMSIPASEAIKRFELARGYEMERKVYIDDILQTKSSPENWRTEIRDSTTERDKRTPYDLQNWRRDSTAERDNPSPYDHEKQRRDSTAEGDKRTPYCRQNWRSRSPHDLQKQRRDSTADRDSRSSYDLQIRRRDSTAERDKRSPYDPQKQRRDSTAERDIRSPYDLQKQRRDNATEEHKNSRRSSCYEIDYSFDY